MAVGGALIGALRVTLGMDTAQFEAGSKRARNIAKRDVSEIQKTLNGLKTAASSLLATATVTALTAAAKRALDYAAGLGEVAQQIGVTTTELQEYRYAASQVGLTNDEVDKSLTKLTRTIGEARAGSKAQVAAFRELGVALQDANGRLYSTGEVMPRVADALAKIEDPARRARLEVELFGRTGQKLDTLLSGGSAAINELRNAAHRLGIVLSEEQIQKADETADKLAAVKQVLEARLAGVVADNADAIMSLVNAFLAVADAAGTAVTWIGNFIKRGQQAALAARGWMIFGAPAAGNDAAAARWKYSLNNQFDAIDAMARAGTKKPPTLGTVAEGALPSASGGGGRGRSRGGGRNRAADLERYNSEIGQLRDEQLRLQQDITTDVRERARLEHLRIETEEAAYNIDVESRRKSGELTQAQAEALKLQYAQNAQKQHTLVNWQLDDDLTEQELDLKRSGLEIEKGMLDQQLDAARTQEDRRRILLRILENDIELERASLEAIKAKHKTTDVEYRIAEAKLKQLDQERAGREGAIRRDTMGPLERYIDELPKNAAELNEDYQRVAVDGLQSLNDGLAEAIMQSKSLGDVFSSVADQIVKDLLRIAVQQMITQPLAGALFDGKGGGGFNLFGLFGKGKSGGLVDDGSMKAQVGELFSKLPIPIRIPGLATGGSFKVGGLAGTDRNVLAINGIPRVRVSADERVTVHPANDRGSGGVSVVRLIVDEAPSFASTVRAVSTDSAVQVTSSAVKRQARGGRMRLA